MTSCPWPGGRSSTTASRSTACATTATPSAPTATPAAPTGAPTRGSGRSATTPTTSPRCSSRTPTTASGTPCAGSTRPRSPVPFSAEALAYARRLAVQSDRFADDRRVLAELLERWDAGLTANPTERRMALRLSQQRAAASALAHSEEPDAVKGLATVRALFGDEPTDRAGPSGPVAGRRRRRRGDRRRRHGEADDDTTTTTRSAFRDGRKPCRRRHGNALDHWILPNRSGYNLPSSRRAGSVVDAPTRPRPPRRSVKSGGDSRLGTAAALRGGAQRVARQPRPDPDTADGRRRRRPRRDHRVQPPGRRQGQGRGAARRLPRPGQDDPGRRVRGRLPPPPD